eukprot:scaffold107630_cov59-Phaeocystis_antarctica.AAC.4
MDTRRSASRSRCLPHQRCRYSRQRAGDGRSGSRDAGADRRLGFGLQRAQDVLRLALEARNVRRGTTATP